MRVSLIVVMLVVFREVRHLVERSLGFAGPAKIVALLLNQTNVIAELDTA